MLGARRQQGWGVLTVEVNEADTALHHQGNRLARTLGTQGVTLKTHLGVPPFS